MGLETIRKRVCLLGTATGLGAMASIFIFIKDAVSPGSHTELFLAVAILTTSFLAGFSIVAYGKLKTARLIIENQILRIQPAVIDTGDPGETCAAPPGKSIEVFISCFGILLDSRIIKFNLDGIRLEGVEIGREFISLTYGTDRRTQRTRLLHETMDSRELQNIVEKFRYETGVVPVVTDYTEGGG